jgi:hypothetical protein
MSHNAAIQMEIMGNQKGIGLQGVLFPGGKNVELASRKGRACHEEKAGSDKSGIDGKSGKLLLVPVGSFVRVAMKQDSGDQRRMAR